MQELQQEDTDNRGGHHRRKNEDHTEIPVLSDAESTGAVTETAQQIALGIGDPGQDGVREPEAFRHPVNGESLDKVKGKDGGSGQEKSPQQEVHATHIHHGQSSGPLLGWFLSRGGSDGLKVSGCLGS